jgi:hypothetical protein
VGRWWSPLAVESSRSSEASAPAVKRLGPASQVTLPSPPPAASRWSVVLPPTGEAVYTSRVSYRPAAPASKVSPEPSCRDQRSAPEARPPRCQSSGVGLAGTPGSWRQPQESWATPSSRSTPGDQRPFTRSPPWAAASFSRVWSTSGLSGTDGDDGVRYGKFPRVEPPVMAASTAQRSPPTPTSATAETVPKEPPVISAPHFPSTAGRVTTFTAPPSAPAP